MWHATNRGTPGGEGGGGDEDYYNAESWPGGPIINDYEELWYSFMLI